MGIIGSAVNRYSNLFCIYSASEDKKLYKDYLRDALFLNIGSGGFYHKKWLNFDFPVLNYYLFRFDLQTNYLKIRYLFCLLFYLAE